MAKSRHSKQNFQKKSSILHKQSFKSSRTQKSKASSIQPTKYSKQKGVSKPPSNISGQKNRDTSETSQTTIPFSVYDRILLIGDGDFSFSASLVTHHGVADIWATTFDSEEDCYSKYPGAAKQNVSVILDAFEEAADSSTEIKTSKFKSRVLFNIDATGLNKHPVLRSLAPFHRIIFNFPHVGGLSTDVNRQVRANQKLLSDFFHACIPLLSSPPSDTHGNHDDESQPGSVIVTLFEGEPYTLWNPRDLARHAGLYVWRSWRFEPRAFPGYRHVRTAGTIVDKTTGDASETAWRGEDRLARVYEFGFGPAPWDEAAKMKRKKSKGGEGSDSSEDD